jgi:hypothetical protein
MKSRATVCALALGVAGLFAFSATTFAAPKHTTSGNDSYETMGSKPGMAPPVPGFALSGYKPGLCWKVTQKDYQKGEYVPCAKWHKDH